MSPSPRKKHRRLWLIPALATLLCAGMLLALSVYAGGYARAGEQAEACVTANADRFDGALTFGSPAAETGIILYPGGLVDESAYAPLACLLAEKGMFVAIPSMPFHLAVFGMNQAEAIIAKNPEIGSWYVGGHSLGGAMAASFAAANPNAVGGVILLAAYATKPLSVPVLSLYGDCDTVLNAEKYAAYRSNLPDLTETILYGGNHAQFGDYGAQEGDTPATISPEAQWQLTADAITAWLAALSAKGA